MLHKSSGTSVPNTKDSKVNPKFPLWAARRTGLICAQCHKPFFPTNNRGPVPKYCSRACKRRAYHVAQIRAEWEKAA